MPSQDILDNFDFDDSQFPAEEGDGEVVAKFYSPLEAEVAAARLRAEGIPCFLANSTSQSVMTHLQVILRLHVRPQDALHAREILNEAAIDTAEPTPAAGRNNLVLEALAILIGLLLAILLVRAMWGFY